MITCVFLGSQLSRFPRELTIDFSDMQSDFLAGQTVVMSLKYAVTRADMT